MQSRPPADSVASGFDQLLCLVETVHEARLAYAPRLDGFVFFQGEIKLMHRAILSLLRTIDAPVQQFVTLGLRTTVTSWLIPPLNCVVAMQDVERMINALDPLINVRNQIFRIPDYYHMFEEEINDAINAIDEFYEDHDPRSLPSEEDSEEDPDVVPGATDEQIEAMPVHSATNEDADNLCSICISNFVAGEQIKILGCSHRFHKKCINYWLKNCAICPMDRSRVFTN